MRTTLNLDDDLIRDAREMTGIQEKTALIHKALRDLLAREGTGERDEYGHARRCGNEVV